MHRMTCASPYLVSGLPQVPARITMADDKVNEATMSDPGERDEVGSVTDKQAQVITNLMSIQSRSRTGRDLQGETVEQKQEGDDGSTHDELSSVIPTSVDSMGDLAASMSSEEFSSSDDMRNRVPRVNCAEKIIICLDTSPETNSVSFQSCRKPKRSMFQLVQKAMSIFVKTKSSMNLDHEFGIVVLNDTASWCQHFAKNVELTCSMLDQLAPTEDEFLQDSFAHKSDPTCLHQLCPCFTLFTDFDIECKDMESLLTAVRENIDLPQMREPALPPPYVVRLLLVYSRSLCQPRMSDAAKQVLSSLLASPYFFFDVFYIHELPSENNHCEAIYDLFCELDDDEVGYMLEVSRSTTRLFDHMAALLAHPLQRPKQRDTFYRLIPEQEEETNL